MPTQTPATKLSKGTHPGCGVLQAAGGQLGWPAIFHIVLQLLGPAPPQFSSNAVQATESSPPGDPGHCQCQEDSPLFAPLFRRTQLVGEPVESGGRAFSSVKHSPPSRPEDMAQPQLLSAPCLFGIINSGVPLHRVQGRFSLLPSMGHAHRLFYG